MGPDQKPGWGPAKNFPNLHPPKNSTPASTRTTVDDLNSQRRILCPIRAARFRSAGLAHGAVDGGDLEDLSPLQLGEKRLTGAMSGHGLK